MIPAKYTVVLKSLLDDPKAKSAIDKALSTYPLYTPEKHYDMLPTREELNSKLLNHYKYREIFCSAPGRFIDELEITMNEIMPRYNELYKTVVIMADIEDPFGNLDVVETFEQERKDTTIGSGTTEAETNREETETASADSRQTTYGKNIEVDTPQNRTTIPAKDIDTLVSASKGNWNKDEAETETGSETGRTLKDTTTGSTTAENETTGTTKHTVTRKGNQGVNTYAHDMNEFRTSIIDVTEQIITDARIQELFFAIY